MNPAVLTLAVLRASVFVGVVPLAGLRSQPAPVKAMVSACLAIVLAPAVALDLSTVPSDSYFSLAAIYLGQTLVCAALVIALNELYGAATSVWSVQTGLSYSSVLDPSKESESTALSSLVQLLFLLHFTAMNLHLGLLSMGLGMPTFQFELAGPELLGQIAQSGKRILATGLAWGLPYIALLLSVDVVLAVGARLYERFQPGALSNPLKQVLLLVLLFFSLPLWRTETGSLIASWIAR